MNNKNKSNKYKKKSPLEQICLSSNVRYFKYEEHIILERKDLFYLFETKEKLHLCFILFD